VEPVAAAAAPEPAPAPAPAIAPAPASASLEVVLEQAGLVWVNTDAEKFRAAQEAAARLPRPVRAPRERKPLPPVDATPMQQVETMHR
ncbi:ribonuclease E, partial [Burkholderia sp. TJI49]